MTLSTIIVLLRTNGILRSLAEAAAAAAASATAAVTAAMVAISGASNLLDRIRPLLLLQHVRLIDLTGFRAVFFSLSRSSRTDIFYRVYTPRTA